MSTLNSTVATLNGRIVGLEDDVLSLPSIPIGNADIRRQMVAHLNQAVQQQHANSPDSSLEERVQSMAAMVMQVAYEMAQQQRILEIRQGRIILNQQLTFNALNSHPLIRRHLPNIIMPGLDWSLQHMDQQDIIAQRFPDGDELLRAANMRRIEHNLDAFMAQQDTIQQHIGEEIERRDNGDAYRNRHIGINR